MKILILTLIVSLINPCLYAKTLYRDTNYTDPPYKYWAAAGIFLTGAGLYFGYASHEQSNTKNRYNQGMLNREKDLRYYTENYPREVTAEFLPVIEAGVRGFRSSRDEAESKEEIYRNVAISSLLVGVGCLITSYLKYKKAKRYGYRFASNSSAVEVRF